MAFNLLNFLILVNGFVLASTYDYGLFEDSEDVHRLAYLLEAARDTPYFMHNNCTGPLDASMDKACLTILPMNILVNQTLILWGQTTACCKCPSLEILHIPPTKNCSVLIDTKFPVILSVTTENKTIMIPEWGEKKHFTQYGRYELYMYMKVNGSSDLLHFNFLQQEFPADVNIPIYVTIAILAGLSITWIIGRFFYGEQNCNWKNAWHCFLTGERAVNSDLGAPTIVSNTAVDGGSSATPPKKQKKARLRSLDTFRGLSLTIMIFVNYGGGGYWFFNHSYWNGLTVADLVFPWFTWILGPSICLSFRSLLSKGTSRLNLLGKVLKRTTILFSLGIILNTAGTDPVETANLRIPGVLQRLAISYGVVALVHIPFAKSHTQESTITWLTPFQDVFSYWIEWLIILSLLALHIALTFLFPVDGCPTGYLGPGGLHDNASYINCTGGAAGYIDRWFFGDSHIYQHPTVKDTYHTLQPYDPEGLLGTPTAIFICFLGLQAGKILVSYSSTVARIKRWIIWSILCGMIAGILCKFSQNDGWIPVNKNLWSLSFVLALASMAFFLFTLCYIVIDVLNLWSGAPFYYPGMNSIVVYLCSEIFAQYFPINWKVPHTHTAQLAMDIWGVTIWVLMAFALYYKEIFIAI